MLLATERCVLHNLQCISILYVNKLNRGAFELQLLQHTHVLLRGFFFFS